MKCHACGYIGFDHLSQCSKCGGDLSAVRDKFGFTAAKSSVPCFLGALLKNQDQSGSFPAKEPQRLEPAVSDIPEIEFGDEIEIAGEHPTVETLSASSSEPPPVLNAFSPAGGALDDGLMIDLSEEELNQVGGKKAAEQELELDLDFLLEDGSSALGDGASSDAPPKNGNGKAFTDAISFDMNGLDAAALELTDEDLDQLDADAELSVDGDPVLSASAEVEGAAVLDLTDDDLHSLITELESSAGK